MDLIKHSYHSDLEGFRFGEARVRCNIYLFTTSGTMVLTWLTP